MTVVSADPRVGDLLAAHLGLVAEELNVRSVTVSGDESAVVELTCRPDFKALGPRLGGEVRSVADALTNLTTDDIVAILDGTPRSVAGHVLGKDDIVVQRTPRDGVVVAAGRTLSVALDTVIDDDLLTEGVAREAVAALQRLRRDLGLDVSDRVSVRWASDDPTVAAAFSTHGELIAGEVLATSLTAGGAEGAHDVDLVGRRVSLLVTRA